MDKKQLVLIGGAIAAILGLYFILNRRDAIVQVPQIGRVGTAPGTDTTPQELAFKANVFSTYADYLKAETAANQRTLQLRTQASIESERIAAGISTRQLAEAGQTERARIFADADVATAGQRSQSELARLTQQNELANRALNQQRNRDIINAALGALSALTGTNRQQPQRGGSSSGGGIPSSPPFNPNSRRPNYRVPVPAGINPILFDPGYNPQFPAFDPFGEDYGFGFGFGNYDPFWTPPGESGSQPIFSDEPREIWGTGTGNDDFGWDWWFGGGNQSGNTGSWNWSDDDEYDEGYLYA